MIEQNFLHASVHNFHRRDGDLSRWEAKWSPAISRQGTRMAMSVVYFPGPKVVAMGDMFNTGTFGVFVDYKSGEAILEWTRTCSMKR